MKGLQLIQVEQTIANYMDKILKDFSDDCKITVIVTCPRQSHMPYDRDFMLGNEKLQRLIDMLEARKVEGKV